MARPAEDFAAAARGVDDAESFWEGDVVHEYRGQLEGSGETVRLFTTAPGSGEAVETAFRDAAGQWHTPSTHPNIVTVQERGTEPRPWIAVDVIDGRPLDEVQTQLSVPEVGSIVSDASEALRNAALYNVSHGTLSPETVWLGETETGPKALVDDWGLKRACRVAASETPSTTFTAPELADNPEGVSEQTDVYSLGALTYYALAGHPPSGPSKAGDDGPIPPSAVTDHPGVDETVDDVVLTALAPDPANRYDSAYLFNRAIMQALPTDSHGAVTDAETDDDVEDAGSAKAAAGASGAEASETEREETEGGVTDDDSLLTTRRTAVGLLGIGTIGLGGLAATQLGGNGGDGDSGSTDAPVDTPEVDAPTEVTGDFSFSYAPGGGNGDGAVTITYDSGDPLVAQQLQVLSSDGDSARWHELSSTSTRASGEVTAGAEAAVSGAVLNWNSDITSGEEVTIIYHYSDGSTTRLVTFSDTEPEQNEDAAPLSLVPNESFLSSLSREPSLFEINGETLYTIGWGWIEAFDIESGAKNWEVSNQAGVESVISTDERLYIGGNTRSGEKLVQAIDTSDGTVDWTFDTDELGGRPHVPGLAATDNELFVGVSTTTDDDGENASVFYSLWADDGRIQVKNVYGDDYMDMIAHHEGIVYIGVANQSQAYDVTNQMLFSTNERFGFSVNDEIFVEDDILYSTGGNVFVVDLSTRSELFSAEFPGSAYTPPARVEDTVVAGTDSGIYGFSFPSGEQEWHVRTTNTIRTPIASYQTVVFMADQSDQLYAVDARDGEVLYDRNPVADADGINYIDGVETVDGKLLLAGDGFTAYDIQLS